MATVKAIHPRPHCQVEGCHRKARSAGSAYCETHYYRLRRTGRLDLRAPVPAKPVLHHSNGYLVVRAPGHPLRQGKQSPYEYQHRTAYFEAYGCGPFQCHVCSKPVSWACMHVDHLNDDPSDNRIANLAAACPTCNQWRGKAKMVRTMRERYALMLEYDGRTMAASEWAAELGITRNALSWRLANGWSLADALTKSRGKFGPLSAKQSSGRG